MPSESPLAEFRNVTKTFGECRANRNVSFRIFPGTVHALVGGNGAGKTTAMKMLQGEYAPTSGDILYKGKKAEWRSPRDAIAAGVSMVYQHFTLCGPHTVYENVVLGLRANPFGLSQHEKARAKLARLIEEFGLDIGLDERVEDLPIGKQQSAEILKVLYRESDLIILDEPTAVLGPAERDRLFAILRTLVAKGRTVVLITHKLKEVMAIADHVTVLREGDVVAGRAVKDTSPEQLAEWMVGGLAPRSAAGERGPVSERARLRLENFLPKSRRKLQPVNLCVHDGEILGLAGVEGSGQSELLRAILFRDQRESGRMWFGDQDASRYSVGEIRRAGVALFPEDRLRDGALRDGTLEENFLLGRQRLQRFVFGPFFRRQNVRNDCAELMRSFQVKASSLQSAFSSLSGGNQQKLVVARELSMAPKLLLAAQPTRGVDIGAASFIHEQILSARARGAGVLLFSFDLDELMSLSDRILVMYQGGIFAEFTRADFSERGIGAAMAGVQERSA